jgi:protein SHQ1
LASQETNTERSEILHGMCINYYMYSISWNWISPRIAAANDWTVPQTIPDTLPVLETSLHKPYGFLNAYTGYFIHVANTENEINELGADAETLTLSERRIRRLKREDEKWDPEYYMYVCFPPPRLKKRVTSDEIFYRPIRLRADFADTEQIDQLIAWTHPHLDENVPHAINTYFTEAENAAMLRLPRKECNALFSLKK